MRRIMDGKQNSNAGIRLTIVYTIFKDNIRVRANVKVRVGVVVLGLGSDG